MLHLDDVTILDLLDLPSVTDCMAETFAAWDRGTAATTQRVRAAATSTMASAMAAVVPPFSGGKVYTTIDGRFAFVVVLFDEAGRFLCTLDGDALTRLRTAALSAVAVRHLAAPAPRVAAIVGSGNQAWYHALMLQRELPGLADLRIHARRPDAAHVLTAWAVAEGIPARPVATAAEAVDGADVVVTVTASPTPLFPAEVVAEQTLVCAVGATKPDRAEIGPDVVERCLTVVADDVVGSHRECGDLIQAAAHGRFSWDRAVELHAVVGGSTTVPRADAGPVLYESQGVALQDVAAAALAWQRYHHQEPPLEPPARSLNPRPQEETL